MTKPKPGSKKSAALNASASADQSPNKSTAQSTLAKPARKSDSTLAELRNDRDLWYKVCVLLYDLHNLRKDKTCESRTLQTTDPQYISAPYFSDEEAATVKGTVLTTGFTVEEAITKELENFFEKRKASGDWRPCGPHDMAPMYLSVFGIDKSEIEDEKFVSRIKRSGLGVS